MCKNLPIISILLLCIIMGCKTITKKEDILAQARQIKASVAQEPLKVVAAVRELSPLPEREKLVYKAKFLGLSIGSFIIRNNGKMMFNGQEVYQFDLTVKTLPFFSIIFKTKDRYVAYMDAQKFVVVRHEEYIKGGAFLESAVDFDYKSLTATYKNFTNQQESSAKIPDKLLDILTGGFYLRLMPLELGDTVDLNIYADGKSYNCTGLLAAKTRINVPNHGKQDAYRFEPYLFLDGEPIKKISAVVFFSLTTPRKPLHATLNTSFGKVHVVLIEGYV